MTINVLIVDDEENICFTLGRFLRDEGYIVATAEDFDTALVKIQEVEFDLVFADILLKGHTGIDILKAVNQKNLNCPVIMITGVPTVETASEAVRLGAFDYLPKPVLQEDLLKATKAAIRHKELIDEKIRYKSNMEAIFSSVKDALICVDRELNIIDINTSAEKICGIMRNTCRGKSFAALKPACSGRCIRVLQETIASKKTVEYTQVPCEFPDKNQVVTLTASPLLAPNSELMGGLLTVRDQTRLFALERDLKLRRTCHNIIGKNEKLQEIFSLIDTLADVKTTVLISGESGTGKELVAEALHFKGTNPDKPLVKVNCSALSENLLESELFGHIKGAFSGAIKDRVGRFELAHGGTIFLDEVGEMSPRMQLRLLRVLQEQEFEKVGDSTTIKVDVRVIAATNLNLLEEVNAGRFRKDLYYRLKVVEIRLPLLQQRKEDIPLLVDHFVSVFNKQFGRQIKTLSQDVQKAFMNYPWPGNIRELQHTIEHAFILCRTDVIELEHLPREVLPENRPQLNPGTKNGILQALEKTRWNITEAAKELNVSRQNLYRKMKYYKISRSRD